jgi:hypothetical protein
MLVEDLYAHVQRMISVVKMATVLEKCSAEEIHFVVLLCGQKDSVHVIFIKECFLFRMGSVCRLKRLTTGSRNVANILMITKRLKRKCGSG